MAYDLIKISGLPLVTPDSGQDIVVGVGDYAKRINYNAVKADMVGTSPSYTTDTEPYLIRQTTNVGVVGKCALNKLVGGSLGWNQLTPTATISQTSSGITFSSSNNGTISVSGTATARAVCNIGSTISGKLGHVFLIKGCPSGGSAGTYWLADGYDGGGTQKDIGSGIIIKKATDTYITQIVVASGTALSGTKTFVPQAFDLTAMFGSTIADYVYGLEQATTGSGVAWLSKYIDLGTYHAYDAGSIQSVQAMAHATTGKNLFDSSQITGASGWTRNGDTYSGAISSLYSYAINGFPKQPLWLPNTAYAISVTCVSTTGVARFGVMYTDGTSETMAFSSSSVNLRNTLITNVSKTVKYFYFTYNSGGSLSIKDIQIEFGSTGTAYEPYTIHNYPLGSDTLRGIPQLVSNKIQFDGDEKYPDGTIKRKYGSRAYQSGDTSDGATMITDGTTTVYRLATPTTESSTSYQKIQTIDADGTESFTTSSPVPVGHETQTADNVLAALEWLGE